jgi:hypothetical protein
VSEAADFSNCPNCGAPVVGNFCPECGQRIADVKIGVKPLFLDLLEDQFSLGSALPRTLKGLFLKPGFLTNEYLSLRIARYVAPFRLYLIASLIFFLLLSLFTRNSLEGRSGSINAVADSVAMAISAAQTPDSSPSNAGGSKAALPDGSLLTAADSAALAARATTRRTLSDTKRCGRFASGVMARGQSESTDTTEIMHIGLTAYSEPVFGMTAERGNRNWAEKAQVDLGSERVERAVCLRLMQMGALPPDVAARRVIAEGVRNLPKVMFVLLPLYAFLLKLAYLRRKRFYVEHFVFALHLHAYMFLLFTIMLMLRRVDWLPPFLALWMGIYTWIAMKRVYKQGWVKTTLKWLAVGWTYFIVLTFAALTVFVGSIFTA